MEFEQVIAAINVILLQRINRSLSSLEIELLRGAWGNLTYEEIAEASGYSLNYLQRDVGPKFWRLLSDIYGQKLNKTNARAILTRQTGAIAGTVPQASDQLESGGPVWTAAAPAATLAAPTPAPAVTSAKPPERLPATLLEIYLPADRQVVPAGAHHGATGRPGHPQRRDRAAGHRQSADHRLPVVWGHYCRAEQRTEPAGKSAGMAAGPR